MAAAPIQEASMRPARLTEVVGAILRYLHAHPDTVDSAEGIARWWLPADWCVDVSTMDQHVPCSR
jgi:hypothetical protein